MEVQVNLEQLQARFPAVYKAAVELGVQQERDRVASHVVMGEKVDDVRLAIRSIRRGAELAEAMAFYLQAGRNREDIRIRQAECDEAAAVLENVGQTTRTNVDPFEKQVADRVVALLDAGSGGRNIEDLEDA